MFTQDLSFFKEQQKSYRTSNSRINIWDGPVRSGKTVIKIARGIKEIAIGPPGDMALIGKTNGSLYRNIIRPMEELLGDEMYYHQEHDGRVIDLWGRKIHCFGANDERAESKIRGSTLAGALGDEITLWPESFFNQLMMRLSVEHAKFIGTTNPDNPNHYLKKNYLDRAGELDITVHRWPLEANTFLPLSYIEALKKEYTGLWFRRYIKGEWCVAEGSIYDFFDEDIHFIKKAPAKAQFHLVGIDYGIGNPTSYGLYAVNLNAHPKIWRVKGYYWASREEGRQKTDADYSKDLKKFLGDITPRAVIVDPSAASLKLQIRRDHGYIVKDANNDVLEGIQTQSKMLQSGEYAILENPENEECKKEYYGYIWDENAAKRGEDKPVKTADHTKDEERYVLHTEFSKKTLDYRILTRR